MHECIKINPKNVSQTVKQTNLIEIRYNTVWRNFPKSSSKLFTLNILVLDSIKFT